MKKFQQLLSEQGQNEYGLQYKPIRLSPKSLLKNIQNSSLITSLQNPETVQVYLKSTQRKPVKMKLNKKSRLQKLKETIEQRLSIPFDDQMIYLNGKQISVFSSITLNEKQIIHISNRKNIIKENQTLLISVKVFLPNNDPMNGKVWVFSLEGREKVGELKNFLMKDDGFKVGENRVEFNFLQSGRMLDKQQTFSENLITKNCEITCLLSENEVQTKFVNECQQASKELNYQRIEQTLNSFQKTSESTKKPQHGDPSLKFKKVPLSSTRFLVDKNKQSSAYTKLSSKNSNNNSTSQFVRPHVTKRKSETDAFSAPMGFKKKKICQQDYDSDDSHLLRKIVVHKSMEEIEKLASQNSLIREQTNEIDDEKKSVVSSSSSDQKDKQQYIPIRQQKQYRPCPLIPQRKMAQSQKIKINMQLQKLFGFHEQKMSNFLSGNDQQTPKSPSSDPQVQTTRSRVVMRNNNANMRNSISAKESTLRFVKDIRKSNRYAEENMCEGD